MCLGMQIAVNSLSGTDSRITGMIGNSFIISSYALIGEIGLASGSGVFEVTNFDCNSFLIFSNCLLYSLVLGVKELPQRMCNMEFATISVKSASGDLCFSF
eukprot:NODE_294_length_10530_cov_0.245326.p9 type:complete len:101 gc:universal NODE_294_length_10530_cov_0.245326:941-639(-)